MEVEGAYEGKPGAILYAQGQRAVQFYLVHLGC